MKPILTPRELAEAIGVSESSVKRWVDDGAIEANRTAGGHRRIPIAAAVRFIRESGSAVARPELLGLADVVSVAGGLPAHGEEADILFAHLIAGREEQAKGLIVSLYLGGSSVAELVDGPLKEAMRRIGELWEHRSDGIFLEHRATAIALHAMARLRTLLTHDTGSPTSVGGAAPNDHHLLPTQCAATVLEAAGLGAVDLGANLPIGSAELAAKRLGAKLVWLSVSTDEVPADLGPQIRGLAERLSERRVAVAVGGVASQKLGLRSRDNLRICASMTELEAVAQGLVFAADSAGN